MVFYNNKAVFKKVSTGTWLPGAGHTCVQCLLYGCGLQGAGTAGSEVSKYPLWTLVLNVQVEVQMLSGEGKKLNQGCVGICPV